MASESDVYVLLNQLADEFTDRSRRGERPTLDEYCERHPELAADIRELFPAMVELEDAQTAAENDRAPPVAEVLGDFRLIREVGRGGMGAVYEAEQISLGRRVALKLLTQRLLHDRKQLRRFEREARSTASLHHTNIVPVFGFGQHENIPYFVMQFIRGQPLDAVIREIAAMEAASPSSTLDRLSAVSRNLMAGGGPGEQNGRLAGSSDPTVEFSPKASPPSPMENDSGGFASSVVIRGRERTRAPKRLNYWQAVARIGSQASQALEYAHGQGVIHRDVKPSNLLIDGAANVWVTDFGLAKADVGDDLTATGDVIGTLRYMAPEALDGRTDARSDVFSLGLTLYEMLALRPAYDMRDRSALVKQVSEATPPRLRALRPSIPLDLETIVDKALEREPSRRYQSAAEFAEDLQRFINDEPIRARRQSALEALWRWTRQHRVVASLISAVLMLTIALAVGSFMAAAYFKVQEASQRKLAKENEIAGQEAEAARDRAESVLWEMQTDRGLLAAETGDNARAALWFASAAKQAPDGSERCASSLLRARNWLRETHLPLDTFEIPRPPLRMEFQPGGDLLLVVDRGNPVLRDWRSGKDIPWASELREVWEGRFSPDGKTVALGYQGNLENFRPGRFELREVATGKILHRMVGLNWIRAIAFSRDGRYAAFAGEPLQVLDTTTGKLLPFRGKHPAPVMSIVFDAKGELIATACEDGLARVFSLADPAKPTPLFQPVPHRPGYGSPPAFVHGRRLATVGANAELLLTDVDTGKNVLSKQLVPLDRHNHNPKIVAPANGEWAAMSGASQTVVHPLTDPAPSWTIKHPIWNDDLNCTLDGEHLFTASWDYTVRIWSMATGQQVGSPLVHTEIVHAVSVSPDGRHVATHGDDVIRVWRLGEASATRIAHEPWYWSGRFSFDGKLIVPSIAHEFSWMLAIGAEAPGPVHVRRADGGDAGPPFGVQGQLVDCCVAFDNRTVAAISREHNSGWIEFHDAYSGRRMASERRLPDEPVSMAPNPKRNEIAVVCNDGRLRVVDASTGENRFVVKLPSWQRLLAQVRHIPTVRYTGDGASLVVVDGPGRGVYLVDAEDGSLRRPRIDMSGGGGFVRGIAVSKNGRYFATAVNKVNAAQVWDARTGEPLSKPLLHQGDVYGIWHVSFTPDGERLLSTCVDRQATVWDWRNGIAGPTMKHGDECYRIESTPDGKYVVTASRESPCPLRMWELLSGKLIGPPQLAGIKNYRTPLATLALSPDGTHALVGPQSGMSRFDLSKLVEPPRGTADEYQLLAEVATCQRIEAGQERSLTRDEWKDRLQRLINEYPDAVHPEPVQNADRRRRAARELKTLGFVDEAVAYARAAVHDLESSSSPDAYLIGCARWELAKLLHETKRPAEVETKAAVESLESAVALNPEDRVCVGLLAEALLKPPHLNWRPLVPHSAVASSGATLAIQPDGSILASGAMPSSETYTVAAASGASRIAAIRLDALADPSLPSRGPGRFANGNFHLKSVEALIRGVGGSTKRMRFADADALSPRVHSTENGVKGPSYAVDGLPNTFLDVHPEVGRSHSTAFVLETPTFDAGAEVIVRLAQGVPWHSPHPLGKFRLSISSDVHPLRSARLYQTSRDASPYCRLAVARMLRGEWKAAVEALQQDATTNTVLAWALLDLCFQRLGKRTEADAAFERTWKEWRQATPSFDEAAIVLEALADRLAADPDDPSLLLRRIYCRVALSLGPLAADDFKRLREKSPTHAFAAGDAKAILGAADGAAELQEWKTAIDAFDVALQLDPRSVDAMIGAAAARLADGDKDGFQRLVRKTLETFMTGDDESRAKAAAVALLLPNANLDKSALLDLTSKLAAAAPSRFIAGLHAEAKCRAGDYVGALATWDAVAKRWPAAAECREMVFRAIAYSRLGRTSEAQRLIREAETSRAKFPYPDGKIPWTARLARDTLLGEVRDLLKSSIP